MKSQNILLQTAIKILAKNVKCLDSRHMQWTMDSSEKNHLSCQVKPRKYVEYFVSDEKGAILSTKIKRNALAALDGEKDMNAAKLGSFLLVSLFSVWQQVVHNHDKILFS